MEEVSLRIEYLEETRVPALSIRIMVEMLDAEGHDADAVLRATGLTRAGLSDPMTLVAGPQELAFQHSFVELIGNRPEVWVRTGRAYRWLHYGVGGIAASTATNLHTLALDMQKWAHLTYTLTAVEPIWDDDVVIGFEHDLTEVPEALRAFSVYRDIGAAATFISDIRSTPDPALAFELTFPDPGVPGLVRLLNATSVRFGAARSACLWGPERALQTLPNADPILHAQYLQQCLEAERALAGQKNLIRSLILLLSESDAKMTIDAAARQLGVSKRTLQRRIHENGITFHELRGMVLARRAVKLLRHSNLSIAEIAWHVGYSDPTGFTHAFRRWTGIPPTAFRAGRAPPAAAFDLAQPSP